MKKPFSLSTIFVLKIQMSVLMAQPVMTVDVNYGDKTLSGSAWPPTFECLVTFGTSSG